MICFAWGGFPQYAARLVGAFVKSTDERVCVVGKPPAVAGDDSRVPALGGDGRRGVGGGLPGVGGDGEEEGFGEFRRRS